MSTTNFDRYDLGDNVREDLRDAIYNIAPTQTPFMTKCGTGSADNTYTEWQTDDLGSVDPANARVDGADAGVDTSSESVRIGNTAQISDKPIQISGRAEKVDKAGRSSELSYQLGKASKKLKRDMEAILTGNQGALAGDSSTASLLGGLRAWIETNTSLAGDGSNGGFTAAPGPAAATDGTAAALSWAKVDDVIRMTYDEGGEPDCIMVAPTLKQKISNYLFTSSARVAALYSDTGQKKSGGTTAQASVDLYISDFGTLSIVPNRFQGHDGTDPRSQDLFILDSKMWEVSYLRSFHTNKLAKTGDSEKRQLLVDYTLVSKNEAASGLVGDVDASAAVTP